MIDQNLTFRALLKREALHAVGAMLLAVGLHWLPAFATWIALGLLTVKESLVDPHPTPGYWAKSALDLAVWASVLLAVLAWWR